MIGSSCSSINLVAPDKSLVFGAVSVPDFGHFNSCEVSHCCFNLQFPDDI